MHRVEDDPRPMLIERGYNPDFPLWLLDEEECSQERCKMQLINLQY